MINFYGNKRCSFSTSRQNNYSSSHYMYILLMTLWTKLIGTRSQRRKQAAEVSGLLKLYINILCQNNFLCFTSYHFISPLVFSARRRRKSWSCSRITSEQQPPSRTPSILHLRFRHRVGYIVFIFFFFNFKVSFYF